jgi:superfamily II DNA or RNA helicase
MDFNPHPFQERAIQDLIADPFHALFMEPGLGKTAIVLEAFSRLYEALDVVRALVIAPLRVCYSTWPDEAAKWRQFNELRVCNLHEHRDLCRLPEAQLYLINPESLHRLFGAPNKERTRWVPGPWKTWKGRPEMLVVDELTRFKRKTGHRARTLKRHLGDFGRRIGMTGTPAPNGLLDLHGQMLVIDRGASLDHRIGHYKKNFFYPAYEDDSRRPVWEPLPGSAEKIAALIAPRVTRLEADEYLQLPKRVVTQVPVILPDDAMQQYKQMRSTGIVSFEDGTEVMTGTDSALGKCRQIANGMVYTSAPWETHRDYKVVHHAKIEALKDLVAEIGKPVMVVYEFRHEAEIIEREIPGVARIGGGTSPAEGKRIEDAWNRGEIPALLTHPASGGVGLNIQYGSNAQIWFTPPWDLEQYIQTVGRLERQGQPESNVFVYFLVARGTVDPRVARVLVKKEATQDELLDALKEEMENG